MKQLRALLLIIGSLTALPGYSQPCVRVDSLFESTTLSGCLMLFTDSTNRLSVNDVQSKTFRLLTTKQPNFGSDALTHWGQFTCRNESSQPKRVVVELDNIFFDEVSFYVFDGQRLNQKIENLSWHTAPENRPVPSRYYAFPLDLQAYQVARVFIRMRFKGGIFVCPITLSDPAHYQQQYQFYTLVHLIPSAILAILISISLLFWIAYRRLILIYYALYMTGILGFNLNIEGFLIDYATLPFANAKGWLICTTIAWIANLLFTDQYVFSQHKIPYDTVRQYSFKVVGGFLIVFLSMALLVLPNGTLAFVAMAISILAPMFVVGWLLVGLYHRLSEAKIYLIAILPAMVCGMLIASGGESFLPIAGDKLYVLLYYAPPIEFIILGFGVVRQFFLERETLLLTVQTVQADIIQTQETERQRIATDLHDDLGGTLATIRQRLDDIRQRTADPTIQQAFDNLEPLIQKSGHDLRRIAHNLMPPEFDRLGLRGAIEQLVQNIPAQPTRFEFVASGAEHIFPADMGLNIYRIVSELVQNIQKHAGAKRASVQLLYEEIMLSVLVEDDGVGIRAEKLINGAGIGLKSSKLRATHMGATLQSETGEGGTFVVLEVPYALPLYAQPATPQNPAR